MTDTVPPTVFPYRPLEPSMGEAVAARTVTRVLGTNSDGTPLRETWGQVAHRVAAGNVAVVPSTSVEEQERLAAHIAMGRVLMAGRHLQQGDESQPTRPGEVTTNCSTSAFSFIKKYLLLNGSGVGRSYDDHLMLVDWSKCPLVVPVLGIVPDCIQNGKVIHSGEFLTPGTMHPEASLSGFGTLAGALTDYPDALIFTVPDSREGWAQAVERMETMAWQASYQLRPLILDFSGVRPAQSPIGGMQDRPSSGPLPLMLALAKISDMRPVFAKMEKWEQAMHVDHLLAKVVLVGGARRAARIATKFWRDPGIFRFITIKQDGGLDSANNSVTVDSEFWRLVAEYLYGEYSITADHEHALEVFEQVMLAQYAHGSGEPGLINVDQLQESSKGMEVYEDGNFVDSKRLGVTAVAQEMGKELLHRMYTSPYRMIVNPCGEIPLLVTGGYCVLGSTCPFFADSLDEAIDAAKSTARALVRVNQMNFLYAKEVRRTNRIGLTLVGLHEWAWWQFGATFNDLLDDTEGRGKQFWDAVDRIRAEVLADVDAYCDENGWERPHTVFTSQPAGTIAKLFGITEAAHLPAMRFFLRWVQFRADDPLVDVYETRGYPVVRTIRKADGTVAYEGMSIVGFPTTPVICTIMPPEAVVTATEASIEQQFKWVRLLERHWLGTDDRGNQISYTLKYNPKDVPFSEYQQLMLDNLPTVRCLSVMPASSFEKSKALYGYVPEEPISAEYFAQLTENIRQVAADASQVDFDQLQCASGACPI